MQHAPAAELPPAFESLFPKPAALPQPAPPLPAEPQDRTSAPRAGEGGRGDPAPRSEPEPPAQLWPPEALAPPAAQAPAPEPPAPFEKACGMAGCDTDAMIKFFVLQWPGPGMPAAAAPELPCKARA